MQNAAYIISEVFKKKLISETEVLVRIWAECPVYTAPPCFWRNLNKDSKCSVAQLACCVRY